MREFKRNSAEYRQYIENVITEYNTNGKKNLLFVSDNAYPVVDGVWRVIESCTELLSAYPDYNVLILAPDYKGRVFVDKVPLLAVKSAFSDKLSYQCSLPMFDHRMKKLVRKLKIDLIHIHSPFLCGMYARKLHKRRKIPMIATFHSQYKKDIYKATHSKLLTRIVLGMIMRVFNSADEVWTMHTASRELLYSYGYKGKSRLMPNATPLKPLANYEEVREKFRTEHGLQDKIAFIFVGRIITQKGVLFIVDALSRLREMGLNFKMFFVGNGPDLKEVQNSVKAHKLTDCVQFEGEIMDQTRLASYYAGADLFLFPSMYDVSSIVQIEAATYKTPTVFAEGSVTSCTITNGVNGFVFPMDVERYAQGVAEVVRSGKISQISENAFRDLHIEWKDVVSQNAEIYNSFMNSGEYRQVK